MGTPCMPAYVVVVTTVTAGVRISTVTVDVRARAGSEEGTAMMIGQHELTMTTQTTQHQQEPATKFLTRIN